MAFLSKQLEPWRVLAALLLVFAISVSGLWALSWVREPKWRALRVGMTKTEVTAIMGEPVITSLDPSLDEQFDEWLYEERGRQVRLKFRAGTLASLDGSKGDHLYGDRR